MNQKALTGKDGKVIVVSSGTPYNRNYMVQDLQYNFRTIFDPEHGTYIRSDILSGDNKGKEPYMASFPHLLDIGIMGACKNAHLCRIGCYQNSPSDSKPNMSAEDYKKIMDQISGLTMQVALGGGGSPNEHMDLEKMLAYSREKNVATAYTTSGIGLTDGDVRIAKKYCGAVAVSWYGMTYTRSAINMFLSEGVRTNIHFVLSTASLPEAINILNSRSLPKGIGAIIFLMYKPVGKLSDPALVIQHDNVFLKLFKEQVNLALQDPTYPFKIGFDSCSTPAIVQDVEIDPSTLDFCEAGRFSAYIDNNMVMMPCSFLKYQPEFHVDLHTHSVLEAWESPQFNAWRKKLAVTGGCTACEHAAKGSCNGTCRACNLNICAKAN